MKTGTVVTVVLTAIIFAAIGYGVGDVTMQEPANDTTSQAQTLPAGIDPSLIVRPLAEMVDGDLPAMVDITHTDAVLVFRSSIPLACSVAYGPTLELGMIATDPDMAGAAIVDHNPTLGGLEP
ncbi:MAG: hypothetical protein O7C63_00055, partial [Alphaproteobacteria bacterium]|nr:hypothetical protein [Alphaproteobacteria bacterium]